MSDDEIELNLDTQSRRLDELNDIVNAALSESGGLSPVSRSGLF